jgi:hypothetical protein
MATRFRIQSMGWVSVLIPATLLSFCFLLLTPAGVLSADVKALQKTAKNELRQGQRQMFSGKIDKALEHLSAARTAIDDLAAADPGNNRLKTLENKYKKLAKDLERRAPKSASKAAPAAAKAKKPDKSGKLPGGLVRRLEGLDRSFNKLEEQFAKIAQDPGDALVDFTGTTLSAAENEMASVLKYYGEQVGTDHPEIAARREKLDVYRAKLDEIQSAETAKKDDLTPKAKALGEKVQNLYDAHYAKFEGIYGQNILYKYAIDAAEKVKAKIDAVEKAAIPEIEPVLAEIEELFGTTAMAVDNALHAIDFPSSDRFGNRFEELKHSVENTDKTRKAVAQWIVSQAKTQGDDVSAKTHAALLAIAHTLDPDNAAAAGMLKETESKVAAAGDTMEGIFFSKSPIDPENPQNLTTQFAAGDPIYCLIRTRKSIGEIFKKDWIRINATIDGKKIHAQFAKLHNADDRAGKTLLFEIAPKPEDMTAYSNPDIEYGTSKPNLKQGPQEMTHHLSKLGSGDHTVAMSVYYYGKTWAEGGFTISGDGFGYYADMNKKAGQAMTGAVTLPRAKMENAALEKEMTALLKNAGWNPVLRLNIVDKDWWIDRVAGGNSAEKSRHIAAAALSKDGNGHFYKKVTFHKDRLITGGYGPLYISHTGDRIAIPEENIDK